MSKKKEVITVQKSEDEILYEKGKQLYNEGRFAEAFSVYMKAAEMGNDMAQSSIAIMYFNGEGVEKDIDEFVKWFIKVGESGNAYVQYQLYKMYYYGQFVEQDEEKAMEWLRRAAFGYYEDAMVDYGLREIDSAKDFDEAFISDGYRKLIDAAWFNNKRAQYHYSKLLADGLFGYNIDIRESFKWARKAAQRGPAYAQFYLGLKYYNGEGTAVNMESAFKWFHKAAKRGHLDAQKNVAAMYDEGKGVEQDKAKALEWLLKAAEQGDSEAMFSVFARYHHGIGVEADEAKAMEWAERYDKSMDNNYND